MSWCRFTARCVGNDCPRCPGSDLYIFEAVGGWLDCCGCRRGGFLARGDDAISAIAEHIIEHDRVGDHVSTSLLAWARDVQRGDQDMGFQEVRDSYEPRYV